MRRPKEAKELPLFPSRVPTFIYSFVSWITVYNPKCWHEAKKPGSDLRWKPEADQQVVPIWPQKRAAGLWSRPSPLPPSQAFQACPTWSRCREQRAIHQDPQQTAAAHLPSPSIRGVTGLWPLLGRMTLHLFVKTSGPQSPNLACRYSKREEEERRRGWRTTEQNNSAVKRLEDKHQQRCFFRLFARSAASDTVCFRSWCNSTGQTQRCTFGRTEQAKTQRDALSAVQGHSRTSFQGGSVHPAIQKLWHYYTQKMPGSRPRHQASTPLLGFIDQNVLTFWFRWLDSISATHLFVL